MTPEEQGGVTAVDDPSAAPSASSHRRHVVGVAKGSTFQVGGSLTEYALRFFIGLLLARLLSSADYGMYNLAISTATMFVGFALLGLDDAMVRYVAIQAGRKDEAGLWGTIQIGLAIALPMSVLLGGALFFAAPVIAEGLFDEPRLTPALRLIAFAVPWDTLASILLGVTRGFGRMDHATFGENVVPSVVRLALIAALSVSGLSLQVALVIYILSDIASAVTFASLINRGFPLRASAHTEPRRDVRAVFGFAVPLWVSGLLNKFQKNISALILGSATNVANVGILAIVANVNMISHAAYRAVIVAVKPVLAQLNDSGDQRGLTHLYTTTTRWLLLSNIPFFLAMVLYPKSVLAVFGESFVAGSSALVVLSVAELINAGTGVCGSLIDMTGHTRVKVANSVLWLALAILGNAVLVPRYGVVGAAYAYLVCIVVVNLARMTEMWVLERVVPSWRGYVRPLIAGSVAFGFGIVLQAFWPVGSAIIPAVVQGTAVGLVYVAVVLALGIDEDDRYIFLRATRKLRGKSVASDGRIE